MCSRSAFLILCMILIWTVLASAQSVTFTTNTVIGCTDLTYENYDVTVSGCILTITCEHSFNSLLLTNGATVKHPSGDAAGLHLNITTSVQVDNGCKISASEMGWSSLPGGPGYGGECQWCSYWNYDEISGEPYCVEWRMWGGGGGYGGYGGGAQGPGCYISGGGATYGSATQPTDLGSRGGDGNSYGGSSYGGSGGGAIKINANAIIVNGTIEANGEYQEYDLPGGGSGGSIYLICGTLAGNGTVSADGGAGDFSRGGGGGRIALYYCSSTLPEDNVHAHTGGEGGEGTIYIDSPEGLDCNNNSISDFCDIALGTSLDANENGIPDECESIAAPELTASFTGESQLMLFWTAVPGFSQYIIYGQYNDDPVAPLDTVESLEYDASATLSGSEPNCWQFYVVGFNE
jgi:hypothetical protein